MTDDPRDRGENTARDAVDRAYIESIGAHLELRLGPEDVNELREIIRNASSDIDALTASAPEPSDDRRATYG